MGIWNLIPNDHPKNAIAISSFKNSNLNCLEFKIGDKLELIEETDEWYRGFLLNRPSKLGIFPKTFVRTYDPKCLQHEDASVYEIESLLREWTSVWMKKFDEIEKSKKTQFLPGYFKNLYNLKNIIVENRASIDEIKDLKKSTISKILLGNSLLGLDVIAFDSNYNRLGSCETSTIFLYEELKKNSDLRNQSTQSHIISQSSMLKDESLNESNLSNFQHKPLSNLNSQNTRTSSTYCLKVSLENLIPISNYALPDENSELCVNLYLYKENSIENSYYLCENAIFNLSQFNTCTRSSSFSGLDTTPSLTVSNQNGKFALFCDISERDFELTKNGYKLFLIVYAVKHLKHVANDRQASISKMFAGGVWDLGSNLCNLFNVAADVRIIHSSMILYVTEFDASLASSKNILEFLRDLSTRDLNDIKTLRNTNKDSYLTLTFRIELNEMSYKNACDKYEHLNPRISRKMDFPDIIMPDDFRNEFYVTVAGGEFQKARNYEFVVNLVQFKEDLGKLVEIQVDFDDGDENKKNLFFYKSIVYVKQDKPKWNEIVNVSIPHGKKAEEIKKLYLRFLIRSRSLDGKDKNKMIGTCYIQITNEDGSAIKDTHCYLPMTRLENENETTSLDGVYFPLRVAPNIQKNLLNSSEKLKEFIDVRVKVVSTQLTQNVTLLNLLSFPTDEKPDQDRYISLLTYLDELLSVKDEQSAEIVKFLQAILDKLIDILLDLKIKHKDSSEVNKAYEIHSKQIQPRVFEILVAIFQIIENQSKFASFRTVIDAYLSKNFCITLAHKPLLRIFYDLMNNVYEKYSLIQTPQINKSESNIFLTPQVPVSKLSSQQRNSNLSSSASICSNSQNEDKTDDFIINTIKSMEYIFKFAFRSRELLSLYSKSNNSDVKNDTFDMDIANIFNKMTEITNLNWKNSSFYSSNQINDSSSHLSSAANNEANLTKIQSFILKNLISLLPILIQSKRYSMQKISEFLIGFLQSRYILQTQFLSKMIKTKLFESPESRRVVIGPICKAMTLLLTIDGSSEEKNRIDVKLELVGKVLSELMDVMEKKNIGSITEDMNEICLMLPQLASTFLYFLDNAENKRLFGSILVSVMRLMEPSHYDVLFEYTNNLAESVENLINYCTSIIDQKIYKNLMNIKKITLDDSVAQLVLIKVIYTCKTLLDERTFPSDWFDLLILRNNVVLNTMYHIAERINKYHVENFDRLNKQIWMDYFDCMVKLAIDQCLQLENFNENKRKNVLLKYKDIRVKAASEIKKMWYNLGDKKSLFIPDMVEPFMKVALIPINDIHNYVIPLFYDMINCEYMCKGHNVDFDDYCVPKYLITTLDKQLEHGKGDVKFRNSFEKIMTEKFKSHVNLRNNVDFVRNVVALYDLLVEYLDLEPESCDELKTFYLNEILNFYGNLKRYDIYVKYVEKLRQIHKACKNLVCAAHTLKLHAELLFWTNDFIEPYLQHPSYPTQTIHKNLKELLFLDLINDFTEGQAWEKALELSKILRGIYDSQYELEKLFIFLRKQADLCENIIKIDRYECKYFLVGFYGRKFPRLLQNKQFVFRSEPLEQIMTFRQRVESWFPKSIRINHSNPLTESEMQSDNQYIQIISVQPIYESKEHLKNLNLSTQLVKYYQHNEVNKFKFSFRKDTKLNEDDPTLWWLREKYVTISNSLPDVINFYPVINETSLDISPIQNAINTVKERLEKLKKSYNKIDLNKEVCESDKSLIQGTIDPGVLGGLPKYKRFFAIDNNLECNELKDLIIETINWGESFLDLTLEYLPNDYLLNILKTEQLPKLKSLFDMPINATLRKKSQISTSTQMIESTPKSGSKSSILNESVNKSFLNKVSENYTGRAILSYLGVGDKSSQSQLSQNSHRDSISSIKSINSDDETRKIVLDETVNPKRPLRPNRVANQNTSSPSNSNQSSRPISHLSGEDLSCSLNQINSTLLNNKINEHFVTHEEEIDLITDDLKSPPPKPPKIISFSVKNSHQNNHAGNGSNSQSNEDLVKNDNLSMTDQTKSSSTSLNNNVQFRYLSSKTISDSVLNKLPDN